MVAVVPCMARFEDIRRQRALSWSPSSLAISLNLWKRAWLRVLLAIARALFLV
jgi:hypothetical protein